MRLTINIGDGSYDLEEGNILVEEVSIVRILSGSVVLERCLRFQGSPAWHSKDVKDSLKQGQQVRCEVVYTMPSIVH